MLWISHVGFTEFYGINRDEIEQALGGSERMELPVDDPEPFVEGLRSLLAKVEAT